MQNTIILIVSFFIFYTLLGRRGQLKREQLHELLSNGAKLIDVRTKAEFNSSKVKNSVNIPYDEILKGVKKKKWNKDTELILFCASGMRSSHALKTLKSQGYTQIYNAGTKDRVEKLLS